MDQTSHARLKICKKDPRATAQDPGRKLPPGLGPRAPLRLLFTSPQLGTHVGEGKGVRRTRAGE